MTEAAHMAGPGFADTLQAIFDDPAALSGFGLERLAFEGRMHAGGIPEFEERLNVNGNGEIAYLLRRAVGDGAGEVGLYKGQADPGELKRLLEAVRDAELDSLEPEHPEPGSMTWGLSVVAGGSELRFFTALSDPQVLIPIKALRTLLDSFEAKAMSGPVWTLGLAVKPLPERKQGWKEILFRFANTGSEGIWIDHPAHLDGKTPARSCRLIYGQAPVIQAGITPLPMETEKATLRYPKDSPELIWLGPGAAVEVRAAVEAPGGGPYLGRIAYVAYPGEERTAGQRRFAGAVFSEDFRF
jgi:hypothetical protein